MKKQIKDMDMKELGGFICDALIVQKTEQIGHL